jgi:hypothetical protein
MTLHNIDQHEYILAKSVSLLQTNPQAQMALRVTPLWTRDRTATVQAVEVFAAAPEPVDLFIAPPHPKQEPTTTPERMDNTAPKSSTQEPADTLTVPTGNLWASKLPDAFGFTLPYTEQADSTKQANTAKDATTAVDKDTVPSASTRRRRRI